MAIVMAGQQAKYSADFSFLRRLERYCCFGFEMAIDSNADLEGVSTDGIADDIALSSTILGEESIRNIILTCIV